MFDTNGVMMHYFHWYSPDDGSLRRQVADRAI
jgi:alpha-amylase